MHITKFIVCLAFLCNVSHCPPIKLIKGLPDANIGSWEPSPPPPGAQGFTIQTIVGDSRIIVADVVQACREAKFSCDATAALLAYYRPHMLTLMTRTLRHVFWSNDIFEHCLDKNNYVRSIIQQLKPGEFIMPVDITYEELKSYNFTDKAIKVVLAKSRHERYARKNFQSFTWNKTLDSDITPFLDNIIAIEFATFERTGYIINLDTTPDEIAHKIPDHVTQIAVIRKLLEIRAKPRAPISFMQFACNEDVWRPSKDLLSYTYITFENGIYTIAKKVFQPGADAAAEAQRVENLKNILRDAERFGDFRYGITAKIIRTNPSGAKDLTFNINDHADLQYMNHLQIISTAPNLSYIFRRREDIKLKDLMEIHSITKDELDQDILQNTPIPPGLTPIQMNEEKNRIMQGVDELCQLLPNDALVSQTFTSPKLVAFQQQIRNAYAASSDYYWVLVQ